MCTELLSAGKMEVQSINFDCIDARQEFIADVSIGGLLKPSGVVYITCMQAFVIYKSIKNNFLLATSKPRDVFTKYFLNLIDESNCLTSITNSTCRSGHHFALYVPKVSVDETLYIPKVSDILFNVRAKNWWRNFICTKSIRHLVECDGETLYVPKVSDILFNVMAKLYMYQKYQISCSMWWRNFICTKSIRHLVECDGETLYVPKVSDILFNVMAKLYISFGNE